MITSKQISQYLIRGRILGEINVQRPTAQTKVIIVDSYVVTKCTLLTVYMLFLKLCVDNVHFISVIEHSYSQNTVIW